MKCILYHPYQSAHTFSRTNSRLSSSIPPKVPDGVNDFDRENWDDPCQASEYAMDIFTYLKERESSYTVKAYMDRQPNLSPWMRTLLVDWMVEVQETFELNHETLYLGVKIVDIYLSKQTIAKEYLQLLGAAAMLIACKYDVSPIRPTITMESLMREALSKFIKFYVCRSAFQLPWMISCISATVLISASNWFAWKWTHSV